MVFKILLYWDQVGSIVPREFVDDQSKLGSYMEELMQYNFVREIHPGDYISRIPNFVQPFLDLVDNSVIINERKNIALKKGLTTPIHMEKMFPLSDPLCERGLAKKLHFHGIK